MVAVFACLLAVAAIAVADPPRPNISETFSSYGNLEIHRETTFFGKFYIGWDPSKNHGLQNITAIDTQNVPIISEELYLENSKIVYYLRISGPTVSCSREKASGTLPMYWGWLKWATYTGTETLKHVVYDTWQLHVAGVNFEVLVDQDTPNHPTQYIVTESHSQTKFEFTNFTATAPPSDYFSLPAECS